jgi:hypothetical protein
MCAARRSQTHVKTLRALQITNVEYDQFIEVREPF